MTMALLAALPAAALGWLLVRLMPLAQRWSPTWTRWVFEISLGAGLGLAITSVVYFALLHVGLLSRASILVVEFAAMAVLGAIVMRRSRVDARIDIGFEDSAQPFPRSPWIWAPRVAAGLGLLCVVMSFSETTAANPNGEWDAFSIWNVRAKYLAGGASTWHNAVSSDLAGGMTGAAHPGYPLLVSASVARVWTLMGDAAPGSFDDGAPAAISLLFTLASCGLLFGAIARAAGELPAWLALVVLIATDAFTSQAAFQYADIPLAFFILGAVGLLFLAHRAAGNVAQRSQWPRGTLLLAGLCAGFAAWTKNEGLPFALMFAAVALWRARRAAVWVIVGAFPGVLATIALKAVAQGSEAVLPKTVAEALHKLGDPSRWLQILAGFARGFGELGVWWAHPLLLLVVLGAAIGVATKQEAWSRAWLALPIVGLLAADFALYLVTTAELSWHLSTSNSRVILQVWPAMIFVAFLMLRRPPEPREVELVGVAARKPSGPKTKRAKASGRE
jgi:hypothetical protein